MSSCEAELSAIGSGCVESLGVRSLLLEMGLPAVVQVRTDSSSAKAVANRRGLGKMKHIQLRLLAVQQRVADKLLTIGKVSTDVNLSDLLTKAMNMDRHYRLSYDIGLRGRAFEEACGLRERSASTVERGSSVSALTSVGKNPHGCAPEGRVRFPCAH